MLLFYKNEAILQLQGDSVYFNDPVNIFLHKGIYTH